MNRFGRQLLTVLFTLALAMPLGISPLSASAANNVLAVGSPTKGPAAGRSLLFVENKGQFDANVRFQLRGAGGTWWFTDDAVWLTVLAPPDRASSPSQDPILAGLNAQQASSSPRQGLNLKLSFEGMSPDARLVATDPQPSKMNYFIGNEPAKWRSDVPTFGTVRWQGVYPGVDVVFGQSESGLAMTLETSGVALSALRLHVEGANAVRVDAQGRLVANTAAGAFSLPQILTSQGQRIRPSVDGRTVSFSVSVPNFLMSVGSALLDFVQRSIPFKVGSALGQPPAKQGAPADDASDLIYSTFVGGSGSDCRSQCSMAIDANGATYLVGETDSRDLPTTPGTFDTTYNGDPSDAYVSKLDPSGSSLEYSTYLGGDSWDCYYGCDVAVDQQGDAYITGSTVSSDFPTSTNAFQRRYNGGAHYPYGDIFITKLNPSGSALIYSTYLGGSDAELGDSIALDVNGAAYVTGVTLSADFPTTAGALQTTCGGGACYPNSDAFVTKLNPDGSGLVYSTFLGGSSGDGGGGSADEIGVDQAGAAYVMAQTTSSDFPITTGAYDTTFNGGSDVAIAKLSPTGESLAYSTYLGSPGQDLAIDLKVDGTGTAFITGNTDSNAFPTTLGAFDTSFNGAIDGFLAKLSADGSALVYSSFLGGTGNDCTGACALAVGVDGSIYVAGVTYSNDFPTTPGAYDTSYNGNGDVFVAKLDASGQTLVYGTFLGATGGDCTQFEDCSIAVDSQGKAYVAGLTTSSNFPTTAGAFDTTYNGGASDAFVLKLNTTSTLTPIFVASIDPSYTVSGGSFNITGSVTIHDTSGAPVSNASVALRVTQPDRNQLAFRLTTGSNGVASTSFLTRLTGRYGFAVTKVSLAGRTYDPSLNVETRDTLTVH